MHGFQFDRTPKTTNPDIHLMKGVCFATDKQRVVYTLDSDKKKPKVGAGEGVKTAQNFFPRLASQKSTLLSSPRIVFAHTHEFSSASALHATQRYNFHHVCS